MISFSRDPKGSANTLLFGSRLNGKCVSGLTLSRSKCYILPRTCELRRMAQRTFDAKDRAMEKSALITGITGQDGSYLAELLLGKGYKVYGLVRRSSSFNTGRIDHIYEDPHERGARLHLVYGDLNDASSLNKLIRTIRPDEIYHLGAQSHVRVSFD